MGLPRNYRYHEMFFAQSARGKSLYVPFALLFPADETPEKKSIHALLETLSDGKKLA
jgi:hypothetical protein